MIFNIDAPGRIGWAINKMQCGQKIRRAGWKDMGMWVDENGNSCTKTATSDILMGMVCSQADLMATDWELAKDASMSVEDELRDSIRYANPYKTPPDKFVAVQCSVLERAIKEIELLRLTAGAVTGGESFAETARQAALDRVIAAVDHEIAREGWFDQARKMTIEDVLRCGLGYWPNADVTKEMKALKER